MRFNVILPPEVVGGAKTRCEEALLACYARNPDVGLSIDILIERLNTDLVVLVDKSTDTVILGDVCTNDFNEHYFLIWALHTKGRLNMLEAYNAMCHYAKTNSCLYVQMGTQRPGWARKLQGFFDEMTVHTTFRRYI